MSANIAYYGGIVTNGLVLYMDAAKRDSYPGFGNNWNSVARGGLITGSLVNGPQFSTNGGGSINFDGADDYANFGSSVVLLDLISKSFVVWINQTSNSFKGIIDKDFDNGGSDYGGWGFWTQSNGKLQWWNHRGLNLLDNGPLSIIANEWNQVAVCYNSVSKTANFYINGTLNSSISNLSIIEKSSGEAPLIVAALRNNLSTYNFNGRISYILAYNRLLSASEVLQNYNALKGRFGL